MFGSSIFNSFGWGHHYCPPPPPPPPPPQVNSYQFSAFKGSDLINGNKNYLSIGRSFVMPGVATSCLTVTDDDNRLSGDQKYNETGDDKTYQKADIDYNGVQVQDDVKIYAEQYYVLKGDDGHLYKLLEIEIKGVAQYGNDKVDYYSFIGDVPPAGVSLKVIGVHEVSSSGIKYSDLGAGPKEIGPDFGAGDVAGSAMEIFDNAPGENMTTHTATGSIAFTDNVGDSHTVDVVPDALDYRGILTAIVADETDVDGSGQVDWEFSVEDSDLDDLAEGQSIVQTYDIVLEDNHGGTDIKSVTITLTGKNDVPTIEATNVHFEQSFETDAARVFDEDEGWYGTVTPVPTGTDGIASPDGTAHAVVEQGGPLGDETALFTRFDGYRSVWPGDWTAEVKVYLDINWAQGEGFDYSVAANGSDGAHQRDFIFHVTKDTSENALFVAGSNNTNFDPREDLETINHYEVTTSGWYTLQHVFRDNGGVLAVDLNLIDENGIVLFTETRSDPTDTIAGEVGGNRYGWFTNIDIAGGIEVDAITLDVPGSSSFVAEIFDGSPDENVATLTNTGTIEFADVDLIDTHTINVTPGAGSYLGTFSTSLDDSTGTGAGAVHWEFSVDDSALDHLGAGDSLVQSYDVEVDDGHGGAATETVTITLLGTNDVPIIGGESTGSVAEDSDPTTLFVSDMLTISDDDDGESSFAPQGSTPGDNGYGTFTLDAFGSWTYTASNANPAIQNLAVDETLTDSFTAVSSDGSASQIVTVTITGENDVVYTVNDAVDPTATEGGAGTELIVGSGIPASGFGLANQTDVGVELGLQVIYRQGPTVLSSDDYSDGELHFQVNDGHQSTFNGSFADNVNRAAWSFDYSIATGLDGEAGDLSSFTFKLLYDVDPTAGTDFRTLVLEPGGSGSSGYQWRDVDSGLVFINDDEGTANVTQNSENYGFSFFQSFLTSPYGTGTDFQGPAEFDIILEAHRGTDLLASNHIVVDVEMVVAGEVVVIDGGGAVIYSTDSIQDAIDHTTADGQTILVGDGSYNENVVIDRPLTLVSQNGRGAVTIEGISGAGALGAVLVQNGVNNVTIGGAGQGFHIVGIDNGLGGIENGAVYLQGAHNGFNLLDNEIEANGEHGFVAEFGHVQTNFLIDGNEFSGQTFQGAQPGGIGFSTQFDALNNVPRQLFVMGEGGGGPYVSSNVVFTNNLMSGTTGGISSDDNVSEQGNTMVTIDVDGAVISDNTFTGETARFATGLRARGPNADIENNTFDNTSGGDTRGVFVDNHGSPGSYAGNVFIGGPDADLFQGSPGDDLMSGGDGDDIFVGGLGNDDINGDADHDTSVYAGSRADYAYTYDVDGSGFVTSFTSVTDNNAGDGDEGADTLDSVEAITFIGDGITLDVAQDVQLFDALNVLVGTFDNIQEAVDASSTGFTIRLGSGAIDLAGAGDAQVQISHDLTIIGEGKGVSTIVPVADTGTSGNARGMFLVDDGVNLDVSDLTVDGSGFLIWQAFRDLGSGTFDNVEFKEIKYSASGSPYAGTAIAAFGSASHVDVTNSDFSEIGRIGVQYFGTGASGTFESNTYTGKGVGDFLDYAVEVGAGAVVDIFGNQISDNQGVAASDGSTSAGILVSTYFGPGSTANVMDNTFADNSTGVFVGYDENDTSNVDLMTGNVATGGTGVEVRGDAVVTNGPDFDGDFNWLAGNNGNTLETGDLADVLRGGGGSDLMTGHGDNDVFVFGQPEASDGQNDMDIITDFGDGTDEIHLIDGVTALSVVDLAGSALITLGGTATDVDHILVLNASVTDVNAHLFVV